MIAGVERAEPKFMAENLIHAICIDDYETTRFGQIFKRDPNGYRSYQVESSRDEDMITLLFTNSSTNSGDWGKIDRSLTSKLQAANEILASGGWSTLDQTTYSQRVIALSARIKVATIRVDYKRAEDALISAVNRVQTS